MHARSIDRATIAFGLVAIPVKVYAAHKTTDRVAFTLLHKGCGSRLRQEYVCSTHGDVVDAEDRARGYEVAKNQFVTFTDDELAAFDEPVTRRIEIAELVDPASVEAGYYERTFYLCPEEGGERAYGLLWRVLKERGDAAIARYAVRGKAYLVMLRPHGSSDHSLIVMEQLRYKDEVWPMTEVPAAPAPLATTEEVALARQLCSTLRQSGRFRALDYESAVRKRQLALIEKKVAGDAIVASPAATHAAPIPDLLEALRVSVSQQGHAPRSGRVGAARSA